MSAKLYAIDPSGDESAIVRRTLGRCLREGIREKGVRLRGFAFVLWDDRGAAFSGKSTPHGPIGESLMPSYVHDVLLKQVICDAVAPELGDDIDGSA